MTASAHLAQALHLLELRVSCGIKKQIMNKNKQCQPARTLRSPSTSWCCVTSLVAFLRRWISSAAFCSRVSCLFLLGNLPWNLRCARGCSKHEDFAEEIAVGPVR